MFFNSKIWLDYSEQYYENTEEYKLWLKIIKDNFMKKGAVSFYHKKSLSYPYEFSLSEMLIAYTIHQLTIDKNSGIPQNAQLSELEPLYILEGNLKICYQYLLEYKYNLPALSEFLHKRISKLNQLEVMDILQRWTNLADYVAAHSI